MVETGNQIIDVDKELISYLSEGTRQNSSDPSARGTIHSNYHPKLSESWEHRWNERKKEDSFSQLNQGRFSFLIIVAFVSSDP